MRGSVSIWIFIVGGFIIGLFIITIFYLYITQTSETMIEKKSLEHYNELHNLINKLCWSFSGSKKEYSLSLGKRINGIYITEDRYKEINNSQFVDYIVNENVSFGDYLCIKVEGKRVDCKKLDCVSTMPYIGSVPTEYSLSAIINKIMGNPEEFKYDLELKKVEKNVKITLINKSYSYK